VAVAGARLRGLIARLALAGGQPVSTGALAEAVWDCALPADVANALQTLVSRARRALGGAAAVEQSAAGYRLAVAPDDVDALRFERLVAEGAVAEALALWRGPALVDAGDFAEPFARRLRSCGWTRRSPSSRGNSTRAGPPPASASLRRWSRSTRCTRSSLGC
jgi:DNA-binding SARP family transcriptional activator